LTNNAKILSVQHLKAKVVILLKISTKNFTVESHTLKWRAGRAMICRGWSETDLSVYAVWWIRSRPAFSGAGVS